VAAGPTVRLVIPQIFSLAGRFGLIDFGVVGSVDERLQERLAGLLLALAGADYDQLVDALLEMGVAASRIDRDRLRRDLENLISPYYGQPLGEIALTPSLNEEYYSAGAVLTGDKE
jgi:ubiquinone biosynthesis protein